MLFFKMLAIVSPIFLTMAIGYVASRVRLVSDRFVADANKLIYMVGLPVLLFHTISRANFDETLNGPQLLGAAVALSLLLAISMLFPPLRKATPAQKGSFGQVSIRGNMTYIGLSVIFYVYGQEGLVAAGVFMGVMVGVNNVLSILALLLPQGTVSDKGFMFWFRQLGQNPLVLAAMGGLAWSWLALPMPEVLNETFSVISRMTLPLALIAVGAGFKFSELAGDLRLAAWSAVLKLAVCPLLVGTLTWYFGARGLDVAVAVVMAATPTSTASLVLADLLGGDTHLVTSTIIISTLGSIVTTAMVLSVLTWMGIG